MGKVKRWKTKMLILRTRSRKRFYAAQPAVSERNNLLVKITHQRRARRLKRGWLRLLSPSRQNADYRALPIQQLPAIRSSGRAATAR
jgi:hypothetical protein